MFKLTASTDPKTIMFEGFPDVPVGEIIPVPPEHTVRNDQPRFYVKVGPVPPERYTFGGLCIFEGSNHSHYEDGRDSQKTWPRIVPRFVIDHTKPIGVRVIRGDGLTSQDELDERGYRITARIVPVGTDQPELLRISRTPAKQGYEIDIDPTTGRVPAGTQAGSNLQFFNRPEITTDESLVALKDGTLVRLEVTRTDGVISNIEWKR